MEARQMLTALVVDRSSDPGPDTIYVAVSGANTIVDVNGTQVNSMASSSISSVSITGSPSNDTIEFDYTYGNPVPNSSAPISVYGNGGTNTLSVNNANANITISWRVQLSGNISSTITETDIQNVDASAPVGSNDQAGLFPPSSSVVSTFNADANQGATLQGSGYYESASHYSVVSGTSYNAGDAAVLDDANDTAAAMVYYATANCDYTGSGYNNASYGFLHTNIFGYNSSDVVSMSDAANEPANFSSENSGSDAQTVEVGTTTGGQQYVGAALFRNEYLSAARTSDLSNWYDTLGGAVVGVEGASDTIAYIIYKTGANITDQGFDPTPANAQIVAYNLSSPATVDYINEYEQLLVATSPYYGAPNWSEYWTFYT
jgi:hypothetical protein